MSAPSDLLLVLLEATREAVQGAITAFTRPDDAHLAIQFELWNREPIHLTLARLNPSEQAFRRLDHVQVRYRASLRDVTVAQREALVDVLARVASAADAWWGRQGEISVVDAVTDRGVRDVPLTSTSVCDALTPWIVAGKPLFAGWSLADVYPTEQLWSEANEPGVVLDFVRRPDEARVLLAVRAGIDAWTVRPAMRCNGDRRDALGLQSLVTFALGERAPRGPVSVARAPTTADPSATPSLRALHRSPEGTNVAHSGVMRRIIVSAPCGQSCGFCSIQQTFTPSDEGTAGDRRWRDEITAGIAAGERTLQVTGIDPLAYHGIVPLMAFARDQGYTRVDLHGPSVLLAQRPFTDALLAALPDDRRFYVPLYGIEASTHDAAVGASGQFDNVMAALELLTGRATVTLVTVAMRSTLFSVSDVARFATARGFSLMAQLPFPDIESHADRYERVCPTQTEAADVLVRGIDAWGLDGLLRVAGLAPCVTARALKVHRRGELGDLREAVQTGRFAAPAPWNGRTARVPCPNASSCALAVPCSGLLLRHYVRLHGVAEFQPIHVDDLTL